MKTSYLKITSRAGGPAVGFPYNAAGFVLAVTPQGVRNGYLPSPLQIESMIHMDLPMYPVPFVEAT